MIEIICICVTVIVCVCMLSRANWTITIKNQPLENAQQYITHEDLEQAYEDLDKDPVPNFTDVIDIINKEFEGVNYDE